MKRSIQLVPEAAREVEEAFWWYERQRLGLGFEFLLAFDAAVEGLCRLPEGHEVVALQTRKALLRRFPYLVLYVLEEKRILITAVFHGRRDPRRWSDRVREGETGHVRPDRHLVAIEVPREASRAYRAAS